MLQPLLGAAGVLVVLWLPGLVLLQVVRPESGALRNVALAPAASLGLLMATGLALQGLGLPVRAALVLPIVLALVALACVRGGRRSHSSPLPLTRGELTVLLLVVAATTLLWLHATHMVTRVPANDDGTHHGLFAARILATHSLDAHTIAVGDVIGAGPRLAYYPFGLHLAAALVSSLVGAPVSVSLLLILVSLAAIALPLGTCALVVRLFPKDRYAGPAAALLVVSFPAFPYYVAYWGGLTMIAGVALVAPLVDAVAGAGEDGRAWLVGPTLGLCAFGLFTLHNSEAVTVGVLAVPLVLMGASSGPWRTDLRRSGRVLLLAVVTAGLLLLPMVRAIRGGAAERAEVARLQPLSTAKAVHAILWTFLGTGSAPVVLISAAVLTGALIALRRLQALGWLVGLAALLTITYLSARRIPIGDSLAVPWYGRWDRVVVSTALPFATLGGLGAAGAVRAGRRLLPGSPELRTRRAGAFLLVVLTLGIAIPQLRADGRQLRVAFAGASLAGPNERAAFSWLATHQRPGERVLNDVTDGSGWMYAIAGARPVFAMATHAFPNGWGDRTYLLAHAPEVASDPAVRCAAEHWRVRYAYVGPRVFPLRRHALDASALGRSVGWRRVYSKGGAEVFERRGAPSSPPCPGPTRRPSG